MPGRRNPVPTLPGNVESFGETWGMEAFVAVIWNLGKKKKCKHSSVPLK